MRSVVKLGGTVAAPGPALDTLLSEVRSLLPETQLVIVHGGGATVTRFSQRLGMTARFHHGVRITTPEEMEVVDMVLAGRVNTELVRSATRAGLHAVGLTGADCSLLVGEVIQNSQIDASGKFKLDSRTARVKQVNLAAITVLWNAGIVPIVATVGMGGDGHGVNINADEAARAIAAALDADSLLYLSDVEGVQDDDRTVIPSIETESVERLIHRETVVGGMAAKIRACRDAVRAGIRSVTIGSYTKTGDLGALLNGTRGTTIHD